MNNHLLKLAVTKAARMLGLGALVMSLGTLSLTSCDDDDNSLRPGDGQKVAAILKDNTPYWQGVARGVEAEAKAQGLTAEIFYTGSDTDPQGQLAHLKGLDLTQYKGIVIAPSAPSDMSTDIENVAAQLPVVVIDTPLEGTSTATRAFIGTDNRTAGANFARELLADAPESIPDAYTCLILRLKDSPAIAERVESYKSVLPEKVTPQVLDIEDDTETAVGQIKAALDGLDAQEGFYVIFAANGTAGNCALIALHQREKFATLAAFDVTAEILQGLSDGYVTNICAQNTYGMGSGAVKAIITPNAEAKQYLDTKNITLDNVNSADVEPFLNGIALPELPKIDRSLMTGTFISTSVNFPGMPVAYPENDVITFSFDTHGVLTVGMNYGFITQQPEWYELPVSYYMKGDSIIGTGKGFEMRALLKELTTDGKLAFDAKFKVYGMEMAASCTAQKSDVNYAEAVLGKWESEMLNYEFKADGTLIADVFRNGAWSSITGTYYLRGDHVGSNQVLSSGVNIYLSLRFSISGNTMKLNGYRSGTEADGTKIEPVAMEETLTKVGE